MKQELQQIADHLERINRDLHSESEVWDAELRDRQAKHLRTFTRNSSNLKRKMDPGSSVASSTGQSTIQRKGSIS